MNIKDKLISPLSLFFLGSVFGILPLFDLSFTYNYQHSINVFRVLNVYMLGGAGFFIGSLLYYISPRQRAETKSIGIDIAVYSKKYNYLILCLVLCLLIIVTINIIKYGGIPILMLINGLSASEINERQAGFTFGIQSILNYQLIFLLAIKYIASQEAKKPFFSYVVSLSCFVLFFSMLYAGKRQFLFMAFVMLSGLAFIEAGIHKNKKLQNRMIRVSSIGLLFILFVFVLYANIRDGEGQSSNNWYGPLLHYLTLPLLNLDRIIQESDLNDNFLGLIDLSMGVLSDVPYSFRDYITSGYSGVIYNYPLVEKTSPISLYGMVYWGWGKFGVFSYSAILSIVINYFYMKRFSSIYCRVLYCTCIWPLISLHTYNHFISFMYFFLPLMIFYFIYRFLKR
ncbi:O-antigen polymerase [Aeromonas veronii]